MSNITIPGLRARIMEAQQQAIDDEHGYNIRLCDCMAQMLSLIECAISPAPKEPAREGAGTWTSIPWDVAAEADPVATLKAVRDYCDDPSRACPLPTDLISVVRIAVAKAESSAPVPREAPAVLAYGVGDPADPYSIIPYAVGEREEAMRQAAREHAACYALYAHPSVPGVPREAPETALAADVRRLSMRLEGHNQRLLMQVATVLDRHAAEMSVPREAPTANPKDYPNAFINAVQDAIHDRFSGVGGTTWSEEARLVRITLWGYEQATGRRLDTALTPAPASPSIKGDGENE